MSPRETASQKRRNTVKVAALYIFAATLVVAFIFIQRWVAHGALRTPSPSTSQIYPVEIGSRYHHITGYVPYRLYRWYWISLASILAIMLGTLCWLAFVGLRALRRNRARKKSGQ